LFTIIVFFFCILFVYNTPLHVGLTAVKFAIPVLRMKLFAFC